MPIKAELPVFSMEFDVEKEALKGELSKYNDVVVTLETLSSDKKLAQELSSKGKEYNRIRIDKVKEISAPIKHFEVQMKELTLLCSDASDLIKKQVKVFEDDKLKEIADLLFNEIIIYRNKAEIRDEFRIDDSQSSLVKLTALTKGGSLTKTIKDGLHSLVAEELALQQSVDMRLLRLESESYKAGLESPLLRLNVESFLFSDENTYTESLAEIITSELDRQNAAKVKRNSDKLKKEQAERELAQKQVVSEPVVSNIPENNENNIGKQPEHNEYDQYAAQQAQELEDQANIEQQAQQTNGNIQVTVVATFKVSVPPHIPSDLIAKKLNRMLESAGITSIDNIEVLR